MGYMVEGIYHIGEDVTKTLPNGEWERSRSTVRHWIGKGDFPAEAGRYHDPNTNRPYAAGKRDVKGYRGIRFTPDYAATFESAPRDKKGRPMAVAAGSSALSDDPSGPRYTDEDFPT